MDAVTATSAQSATSATRSPASEGTLINSDFQTFLVMLTTQMQNQDPLNPIDSTDYAAQLATFSGVEQQVKTNTLLESLSQQLGISGLAEMAAWVGMEARVAAPLAFHGAPLTVYPSPRAGSDAAVLVAMDASGREVTRTPVPLSTEPLDWAGTDATGAPLPSAVYTFHLESYVAGELVDSSAVESFARVSEVRNSTAGAVLVLEGGVEVMPSEIRSLRGSAIP